LEEDIRDLITCFKFGDDRFRGLASAEGQSLRFPIDFDGRPYNTLTLLCERVISSVVYIAGHCMTIKSDVGHVGDQVTLWSPMKTFKRGTQLLFYYHMLISERDTTAALTLYTYSQLHAYERRLLEIRGNHGTSWQEESVCLPGGTYQLAFVATHGQQFLSDIALDDIVLEFDTCNVNHGKWDTHFYCKTIIDFHCH